MFRQARIHCNGNKSPPLQESKKKKKIQQSVISTHTSEILTLTSYECDYDTFDCDLYTQIVMSTRSV
jgi:hypothetical protein